MNLWNPLILKESVLPPCHVLYQFKVTNNKLSCLLYQRSGDMGLGVPFNIASAALMTIIFAKLSNLEPYELVHFIGDCHIYLDHEESLSNQIKRNPYKFPKIEIIERSQKKIEDFTFEDFLITNYECHEKIQLKMSV